MPTASTSSGESLAMSTDDDSAWYRKMLRVRLFELRALELLREGRIAGSVHPCLGQEAVPIGIVDALDPRDPVLATYRGHGWAIAKGIPLAELFGELTGRDSPLNGGRGGSAYLSGPAYGFYGENSIVGAGLPIALGLGIAQARLHPTQIVVVSIGDGALNQGNVHEALNMASVLKIPLLVVVENNGWAEMTPSDALTAARASARATGYAIEAIEVDGNDPSEVRRVAVEARARVIANRSPSLIEAVTNRLGGHYSGDAQAYRPDSDLKRAQEADPIAAAERSLPAAQVEAVRAQVESEIDSALELAMALNPPARTEALTHVYAHH